MRHYFNDRPNWNRRIRKAGGEWIGQYAWRWYGTLTFRQETSLPTAKTTFESFITQFGPKFFYTLAIEQHRWRHSVHLHALMGGMFNTNPRLAAKLWFKLYGNAHILRYDREKGARFYVCKFLTNPDCDWDLIKPGSVINPPQLDVLPESR